MRCCHDRCSTNSFVFSKRLPAQGFPGAIWATRPQDTVPQNRDSTSGSGPAISIANRILTSEKAADEKAWPSLCEKPMQYITRTLNMPLMRFDPEFLAKITKSEKAKKDTPASGSSQVSTAEGSSSALEEVTTPPTAKKARTFKKN